MLYNWIIIFDQRRFVISLVVITVRRPALAGMGEKLTLNEATHLVDTIISQAHSTTYNMKQTNKKSLENISM